MPATTQPPTQAAQDGIRSGAPSRLRPRAPRSKDWRDFITYEKSRRARVEAGETDVPAGVDAAFVCVQDEMHREVVIALTELGGLHIMCEKPLATTLKDCLKMYKALQDNKTVDGQQTVFSIGHVLRYSPHNRMLRKLLLQDRVIGDVLSVVHTEPSCHDIDVLLWLLCSPADTSAEDCPPPHLPSSVASTGSLQYFKKSRKPVEAGNATNCLSCPSESSCKYSAKRIYIGKELAGLEAMNTGWPLSIVLPDIESYGSMKEVREALLGELSKDYNADTPDSEVARRNWFGRCVYESDNDVCDEQVVTLTWDDDPLTGQNGAGSRKAKTAVFHMVAQTRKICDRYTHLYGVDGEIYADSTTITVEDFRTGETTVHRPAVEGHSHGGGDIGLTRQFVRAVDMVKNHGWSTDKAQREFIGCTLDEAVRSHAMVFCAEAARREKRVVDWAEWWTAQVEGKSASG
ncbi:hypothetical protein N0V88_004494 [Collariella sp. IMI 366227]|nr:hypothetical protein N0V88_004494 [Collariella sp. IMI 366227]